MDKNKLKSVMALHGDNQNDLAKAITLSPQWLSHKINEKNGADFDRSEIAIIKDRYGLSAEDIDDIFFN